MRNSVNYTGSKHYTIKDAMEDQEKLRYLYPEPGFRDTFVPSV